MKIKQTLKKYLIKTNVLEEFILDGILYRVVERKSVVPWYKTRRALCFKDNGASYIYSVITLDKKARYQPYLLGHQKIIELWNSHFDSKNTLILGCAGCAVPRFIAFNFPEMKTTGIEYCSKLIDVAKKYFYADKLSDRFALVHGDAFDYVINKKYTEKQDIIFVDLFSGSKIPENVFSGEFLNSLYECTNENGIVIFNLLSLKKEDTVTFAKNSAPDVFKKAIIFKDKKSILVLAKSQNDEKLNVFFDDLQDIGDLTVL